MNAMPPNSDDEALLSYGDNEFVVMRPGRYVTCAVSGRRIPLEALRYWSKTRQEPYAGPREATQAFTGKAPSP